MRSFSGLGNFIRTNPERKKMVAKMLKILLVEDNEMNRDMLSRRLQKKGFEILSAANGEEALVRVMRDHPDLVLMDMSLPIMDGWEATRRIRAHMDFSEVPIIGLSAHAMAGDREKALEAGCDDYDTKPVDFDRLMEKIGGMLKSKVA